MPKVLSTPFRAQVITLSALPPSDEDRELSLLCPVRALRIYFERSAPFRRSEQLFVSFGNCARGRPVMKQRLSRWIVIYPLLGYCHNLGSLRYGTSTAYLPCWIAARLSRRFSQRNRSYGETATYIARWLRPFWRAPSP